MSNSRLFPLRKFKSRGHEIFDSKHHTRDELHELFARRTGAGRRPRVRLIASGLARHLHDTAEKAKVRGRSALKQISVRMALLASHKLITIADRIERKARAFQKSR
jgi:hypothetical protein